MDQKPETRLQVFLDTSVIAAYLRGERSADKLFTKDVFDRVQFAINPIVIQELVLLGEAKDHPRRLERLRSRVRLLPLDYKRTESLLPRARALRNQLVHSNDLLLFSSAAHCDFLVTLDDKFKVLEEGPKPKVVNPEEFLEQLEAA